MWLRTFSSGRGCGPIRSAADGSARPAAKVVLTLAVVALHAQRPAVRVRHDDRVQAIDLAGAAEVFDLFAGAEPSLVQISSFPVLSPNFS